MFDVFPLLPHRLVRREGLAHPDAAEPIHKVTLRSGLSQTRLISLSVHRDKNRPHLRQGGDGHRTTREVRPRPAVSRHRASSDKGVVFDVDTEVLEHVAEQLLTFLVDRHDGVDFGLLAGFPQLSRLRSSAAQQFDTRQDHRLTGPGLTGDHRQPGTEVHLSIGDDPDALDAQLFDHPLLLTGADAHANRRPADRTSPPDDR